MKPVFLVGAPRSGTTWLQLMLSQSPAIATCQETHLFTMYYRSFFDSLDEHDRPDDRQVGIANVLGHEEVLELARQQIRATLSTLWAQSANPDAPIFLEKSPQHVLHIDRIRMIFPEARFLQLVRDPRAVVSSLRAVDWGRWTRPGVVPNAFRWQAAIDAGSLREATLGPEQFHTVQYERLRHEPVKELQSILEWVGDADNAPRAHEFVAACTMERLQQGSGFKASWNMSQEPESFYRKGRTDSWKDELSGTQVKVVEEVCKEGMRRHGYEASPGRGIWLSRMRIRCYWLLRSLAWRTGRVADLF